MATIATRLVCSDYWIVGIESTDEEGVSETDGIGHIDDPATAGKVPADFQDDLDLFWELWNDAVNYGAACREQARGDYLESKSWR